ncbi:uncharacterized protein BXIN_0393 [Babesia sp. Xinjiang]|uniref:uncharacterized protein n=1 Tax=Babesia sp. Xinjiang TaxID=462227 RepID=UPI000A23900B|nr:uncharacterized protein BXIN_0393 [Babesia sp. Xinjiang]ORM41053.1 hypothetical protein BXIN_0393 [Babesia sp. Xinjiang]
MSVSPAHKACLPMFTLQHFDALLSASEDDKRAIVRDLVEERRLPKPFRDFVHSCKDPRTEILTEQYECAALDELLDMQEKFAGKCHFRFDVFVLQIIRSMLNDKTENAAIAMMNTLMISRIVGECFNITVIHVTGWLSHIAEQRKIKRRIEHIAAYVGPTPKQITN